MCVYNILIDIYILKPNLIYNKDKIVIKNNIKFQNISTIHLHIYNTVTYYMYSV